MLYKQIYYTPDGFDNILMESDGQFLTALQFYKNDEITDNSIQLAVLEDTRKWLDIYFSGKNPDFIPEYKINNLTLFRREVIDIMNNIDYGKTVTYNDIAEEIAEKRKIKKMSAQAVGGAVGYNPICIIIPCHRVVGKNGNLTGYGGGITNKEALLSHEGNDMSKFYIPKKGKLL